MHLPAPLPRSLLQRQDQSPPPDNGSSGNALFIILAVIAIIFLICLVGSYIILRRLRVRNHSPKYIPTKYLKKKWTAWAPPAKYGHINSHEADNRAPGLSANTSYNGANETEEAAAASAAAAGIDRNTSVRSVMTLPPYSYTPKESEQVIGREGERAGMDTVVEFPETVDDEETRRDEEMESLYQIRLTRRQEIADRELHRQQRREARAAGDWQRLEDLRRESRLRAEAASLGAASANGSTTNVSAATLLAEHQSRGRDRRVSSVTYASVGHVRHDGTRLRANSDESERGGLLDGAAPMGENPGRNRAASGGSSLYSNLPRPHFRDQSTSSLLSISTTGSDPESGQQHQLTPPSTRDGVRSGRSADSELAGTGTSESSPTATRFTPEASTGSDDIGDSHIPPPIDGDQHGSEPPTYDNLEWGDAPAYESPTHGRGVRPVSMLDNELMRHMSVRSSRSQPVSPVGDIRVEESDGIPRRMPSNISSRRAARAAGASRLPQIEILPAINVEGATEPNTPASPISRESTPAH